MRPGRPGASVPDLLPRLPLFHRGDPVRGFFFVLRGQVQLTVSAADGAEKVLEIVQAGESFGEAVVSDGISYPVTATVLVGTEPLSVSPGGLFSTYLRDRARVGDRLTVLGPQGAFGLRETGTRPRWFAAGGTGAAPLLSMARQTAEWREPQPARFFPGVDEPEDVFAGSALEAVAAGAESFTHEIWVWRPGTGWRGPSSTPADRVAAGLRTAPELPDIYVCGPPPLVDTVVTAAVAGGVPPERIFRERFLPT